MPRLCTPSSSPPPWPCTVLASRAALFFQVLLLLIANVRDVAAGDNHRGGGEEVVDFTFSAAAGASAPRSLATGDAAGRQRRLPHNSAVELPEAADLSFTSRGRAYRIRLQRHRMLLPGNFQHVLHYRDGTTAEGPSPKACMYLGEVLDQDGLSGDFARGSAGLSTCGDSAFSGLVVGHGGRAFAIEAVEHTRLDEKSAESPHGGGGSAVPHAWGKLKLKEIEDEEFVRRQRDVADFMGSRHMHGSQNSSGRWLTAQLASKYVEVLAVNDHSRFNSFGGTEGLQTLAQHSAEVFLRVNVLFHNAISGAAFDYNLQVVLVAQHTFVDADPWDADVKMRGQETDHGSLLNALHKWGLRLETAGEILPHDNRVLLSGRDFLGGVVGFAGVSTMCMGAYSGSVAMCRAGDSRLNFCAAVVAHEAGHNFGMGHDGINNNCASSGNIMASSGDASTSPDDAFSSCSATSVNNFFTSTYGKNGQCLENFPSTVMGDPLCGNGFVECGDGEQCAEQCDCGHDDCSQIDPCCDGRTCRFIDASYECSDIWGNCCENCKYVAASQRKVCRASRGECDLPEYCPGGTGVCPSDLFTYAGRSCSEDGIPGLCYGGYCESQESFCTTDITRDFNGRYDITEACASYNDECDTMVCHDATKTDPNKCVQNFVVHDKIMPVPDGMPCWFKSDPRGERRGMCNEGKCVPPQQLAEVPLCGNGGIDFGEECDCGPDGTEDPCCECTTCKLKDGSQCSALESCCSAQTCQFQAAGAPCREAVGECDVTENCTGTSGICPPDEGKPWGTVCRSEADNVQSTCFGKVCLDSLDAQCKASNPSRPKSQADVAGNRSQGASHQCNGLMCCSRCVRNWGTYIIGGVGEVTNPYICSGCKRTTTKTEFEYNGQRVTMWTSGALDGSVLNDPTKFCVGYEEVTPTSGASCTPLQFFDVSSGECLPCHPGCAACSGPRNSDCIGGCLYGVDSRGVCASSQDQAQYAGDAGHYVGPPSDTATLDESVIGHASHAEAARCLFICIALACVLSSQFATAA